MNEAARSPTLSPTLSPAEGGEAEVVVEAEGVTKDYEGGLVQALRGVDFAIRRGERVAIMGPSGSGKTTLLHLIGALDRPTRGRVKLLGQDLAKITDLDRLRGRVLGFVFQLHHLIPNLSLWENVALPTNRVG